MTDQLLMDKATIAVTKVEDHTAMLREIEKMMPKTIDPGNAIFLKEAYLDVDSGRLLTTLQDLPKTNIRSFTRWEKVKLKFNGILFKIRLWKILRLKKKVNKLQGKIYKLRAY